MKSKIEYMLTVYFVTPFPLPPPCPPPPHPKQSIVFKLKVSVLYNVYQF